MLSVRHANVLRHISSEELGQSERLGAGTQREAGQERIRRERLRLLQQGLMKCRTGECVELAGPFETDYSNLLRLFKLLSEEKIIIWRNLGLIPEFIYNP